MVTQTDGGPPHFRLSPAQEWILTIERLRFTRGLQLTKVARLPDGGGDEAASRRVARLFEQQTALRTCITRRNGTFFQEITQAGELSLPWDRARSQVPPSSLPRSWRQRRPTRWTRAASLPGRACWRPDPGSGSLC